MVKALGALGTFLACIAIGCAVAPPPRVVTVVTPYVPVLPLDPTNTRWLGAADCDLQGHPVIYLHPWLSGEPRLDVEHHERVHVLQMESYGGCWPFAKMVRADSMFRLRIESEAYCNVLDSQRRRHMTPFPSYESIVRQLAEDYGYAYERDSVIAALPCHG